MWRHSALITTLCILHFTRANIYNALLRFAVGATDGVVHMWRHGAVSMTSSPRTALCEAAADGAESEWEPLPAVELGSRITSLQWGKEDVWV
jgi:hypothetical protein